MAATKRFGRPKSSLPPAPFKAPPEALGQFIGGLSEEHVYITHIDAKPTSFKRSVFLVPVAMNLFLSLLLLWRLYSVMPWYWQLVIAAFGHPSEATFPASESTWHELGWEVGKRAMTMSIDFLLFTFVWPWPVQFVARRQSGNPVLWRRKVGFRDREVYVRRSREWCRPLLRDLFKDTNASAIFSAHVRQVTTPLLLEQKTGYLLMNRQWDLDWDAMVRAHSLVDKKAMALDAFNGAVLVHHRDHGWLCYDIRDELDAPGEGSDQIAAFRDALAAMGKSELFYRWVETVQFEATRPGGFGPEQQEAAATKIRTMFNAENIDFDSLWKETNKS
ncbi:uncharacterized protein DCS_01870 [Drechmeria coniospora]|uniref:Uncharacterized protein n=1 Tax=Drechmeria coniospora TaxID=98403 RepID=A0A151GUN7_DRECN|nr:uncharacterized protein DCS_01870 [Drechmeria coniospora]KYK60732.1 uncharacterized protein DCS_01870 [Drechmeria coniospora]